MVPAPQRRVNLGPVDTGMSGTMSGLRIPGLATNGCGGQELGCLDVAQTFTMGEKARGTSVTAAAGFGAKIGGQEEDTQGYRIPEFQPRRITYTANGNSGQPTTPTIPEPLPYGRHAQQPSMDAATPA